MGDSDHDVSRLIAGLLHFHGNYHAAIEVLESANRDNYYVTSRVADCYILLGNSAKAMKHWNI